MTTNAYLTPHKRRPHKRRPQNATIKFEIDGAPTATYDGDTATLHSARGRPLIPWQDAQHRGARALAAAANNGAYTVRKA